MEEQRQQNIVVPNQMAKLDHLEKVGLEEHQTQVLQQEVVQAEAQDIMEHQDHLDFQTEHGQHLEGLPT